MSYIGSYSRTQLQRIVITSSCSSVMSTPISKPTVFSERDWNESSIKAVRELGDKAPPMEVYRASKTLAEKGDFFILLIFGFSLSYTCIISRLGIL